METTGPVLLFDGECGLCVRCVKVLLALDRRRRRLKFAPLQGATAQFFLRERGWPTDEFDSAIFVKDWSRRHEQSPLFKTDALLSAARTMGGFWKIAAVLHVVPRRWRDAAYSWVARRRRQFFGAVAHTDFLNASEQDRFLP